MSKLSNMSTILLSWLLMGGVCTGLLLRPAPTTPPDSESALLQLREDLGLAPATTDWLRPYYCLVEYDYEIWGSCDISETSPDMCVLDRFCVSSTECYSECDGPSGYLEEVAGITTTTE